ncbi:MAG: 23S rRNA (pseudouridine(1915)-N(3))-methyltransferase RlmH [Proteobacteria bacterium]|nr:23S rRNA (pseudouridine(1915)-N(3))-methyltransferase RlmH [Pseudomonadota bacterium]
MKILIGAVGRARSGPEADLFTAYAARLARPLRLREVVERRPLPPAELRRREAELLLALVPAGARVVALDERGRALSSAAFAQTLGRWRDEGAAEVAFLIGGAEGLAEEVRGRADLVLSLGPMTWPHLLVRALLAEQLYRAQAILSGHPYHRD